MALPLPQVTLPPPVSKVKARTPQANIPPTLPEREQMKNRVAAYVARVRPVPPMPLDELRQHAQSLLHDAGMEETYLEYTAILINNALWRNTLAQVPYERRLLLMPKCLRKEDTCPAPFDEFGLLCKSCGQCSLQELQEEAERLGYAVLIAEGSALVMAIIQTGKIDAIVGVSCLSVLEKAFPYMESAAIPGVAIPLLQDDCKDTNVDLDWVWDVIHLTSEDRTYRLDLDSLRRDVAAWFAPEPLDRIMGPSESRTEEVARQWLARDGKRWRPFLTACAWRAFQNSDAAPEGLQKLAAAVECFHKASLIHDDIEDEDATRYGQPTLHAEHGLGVALNAGDLLLGEGYRLIAQAGADATATAGMLEIAALGHRDLCLGQGEELAWARKPEVLASRQVLEIFRRKTAPAFEVALRLGAQLAGADETTHEVLREFSANLGIAYQIRDDLEDWLAGEGTSDAKAGRPTLLPALAHEMATGEAKALWRAMWEAGRWDLQPPDRLREMLESTGALERGRELLEAYKEHAVRCLRRLENPTLKGLLRRVMTKIFNDLEIKGWCREFEIANAASRQTGAQIVG